jgi:hypothetical protein
MLLKNTLCGIAALTLAFSCGGSIIGSAADNAASATEETESKEVLIDTFTFGGHVYQLYSGGLTWNEAKEACEQRGGHLATITSADEQTAIQEHLDATCNNYWLGGYRDAVGEPWKWVIDEEKFDYKNWSSGEPNNSHSKNENYIQIFGIKNGSKNKGSWNDAANEGAGYAGGFYNLDKCGFICEFENANPDVTYKPGNSCVKLEWNTVPSANNYAVYGNVNGKWTKLSETTDTSYIVRGLTAGKEYEVAVIAQFGDDWCEDYSKSIIVKPNPQAVVYPKVSNININSKSHQAKIDWEAVPGAEKYGVAVLINGKWKVQGYTDADTTTITTPKLKTDTEYKLVICAKVNGKWETGKINERAFRLIAL